MTQPQSPSPAWARAARTPVGAAALVVVVLVVVTALVAPAVWGDTAAHINTDAINQGASSRHLFGTDALGRDILARTLVATRLSLVLALIATGIGLGIGVVLGAARIILGPAVARAADVVINVTNAFPNLLMILFFAAVFGVTTSGAVFALGLSTAPSFARLTRTLTASVEQQGFVDAARVCGVGRTRILLRHVLLNVAEALILNATLAAGGALLAFGGLSFLGIGIQPPSYDYGRLLNDGLAQFYINPMAVLGPAAAVVVAGLGFNLLGEAAAGSVGNRGAYVPRAPRNTGTVREPRTQGSPSSADVVRVRDLTVSFGAGGKAVTPVRGVDLDLAAGERVGVVGESGSGKSLTALGVAQLVESPASVTAATVTFAGVDLRAATARDKRTLLGSSLSVVFQNPMSSFNPVRRLGWQLADGAREHERLPRKEAFRRAQERLADVGISRAGTRAHQYPHELSGGMQQRAMIAMGLMGTPRLIIADEPTTALDVMTQSRVLSLLDQACARDNAALLLISHDITVIRRGCDRVLVMYAGRVVEDLPSADLATAARHPYTTALLSSVPDLDTDRTKPLTVIPGRAPEPGEITRGCPFAPRCPRADDQCLRQEPDLVRARPEHRVACWHPAPPGTPHPTTDEPLESDHA
ncbi:dipeptide/oligopeptide/nickel ABC transporter permease/ATP-binding protein [Streptomyces violaceusniger]|uniref:dipeptide/oligopeptide/nickel ABC transporter permease/ATP-binding protein n=1 Tax=Streptomyces violaceusniger TaxID=68280 RepID=UPI00342D2B6D